jgi:hypothetical protein
LVTVTSVISWFGCAGEHLKGGVHLILPHAKLQQERGERINPGCATA